MYEAPSWLVWVLVSIGILIAVTLTYHDLRKDNLKLQTEPKTVIQPQPRKKFDIAVWQKLRKQMENKHGHIDDWGLENDIKDGVDLNIIMNRNCTKCGKPRNQWEGR